MSANNNSLLMHFTRNGNYGLGGDQLLVIDRGEGPYVFDDSGNRYIDGLSSLFCCQLGYSYGGDFAEVAGEQLRTLPFNTIWGTAHPAALDLADRLASLAPLPGAPRVFFTNGGAESVEAAWKIACQYHYSRGDTNRTKAIARNVAYHGVTLGALAITGVPSFRVPFGPPAIDTIHVSNTNRFRSGLSEADHRDRLLGELEEAIESTGPETIAAIFAEPVQNAGGCFVPPEGYWDGLREIADGHGILIVADEVITGMGRLGHWFGCERIGARPDIITLAKGITSAHAPMGAAIVSEAVAAPLFEDSATLLHGTTFGGHPLAAAIAIRNLELFESEEVLENVRSLEPHLERRMNELRDLPIVGDVRGLGFFWAAELVRDGENSRFDADERERLVRGFLPGRLREAGIIARPDDRGDPVLQIAPPLICTRKQLDEVVDAVSETLVEAGERFCAGA